MNLPVSLNKNPSYPCLIRKIRVLNKAKIAQQVSLVATI